MIAPAAVRVDLHPMIHDRTIICIANAWNYDPTSKHHVMRLLSRRNRIVWVNYRGTRRPRASAADLRAAVRTVRAALSGPRWVEDSILQVTPLVFPGASSRCGRALNRRLLIGQIQRALARMPAGPVQLWTFAPDVYFLAGNFGEECVVYYCVDEYSAFEDFNGRAIQLDERRLVDRSDLVVTTSSPLQESKQPLHPQTHLVRHGVDFAHFAAAVERDLPEPVDMLGLPRPVYGFFGLMHHWFDVELLAAVAKARAQASFVLIGDCHADVSALRSLPNVHLLGRRSYRDLPAYCAAFDVALVPFRINSMTRNINPIKLREYLAAGLPVVSTPLPEAARYEPDVLIARDCESFSRQCDRALTLNDPAARRRRSARMAGESWEAVVERLCALVGSVCSIPDEPYLETKAPHRRPGRTVAAPAPLAFTGASRADGLA